MPIGWWIWFVFLVLYLAACVIFYRHSNDDAGQAMPMGAEAFLAFTLMGGVVMGFWALILWMVGG